MVQSSMVIRRVCTTLYTLYQGTDKPTDAICEGAFSLGLLSVISHFSQVSPCPCILLQNLILAKLRSVPKPERTNVQIERVCSLPQVVLSARIMVALFDGAVELPATELAHTFAELMKEKQTLESDTAKLEVLFYEMLQMCLWYVINAAHSNLP